MLRDTEEIDALKSGEFKKLKTAKEELLPGSYNSEAIKGVQSFLNKEGYTDKKGDTLDVDGIYGANTANAVMKYQRANGLSVDGIVGDETWNSIYGKKKKDESKEKNTFGKNPFDVWKRGYNPLAGNRTEDGEDLHERVRNGWESRTLPERMVDFSGLIASEDTFSKTPPKMPERYTAKTENFPKAERLANDFAMDYSAFKENDFPDYELFSNSAGGKKTQTKSDNAEKITGTKVEPEADEGGVIKPGYNQRGHWSQDPDADNYGKNSAKYMIISKLDTMCETANEQNRENIINFANDFRNFDEEAICMAYYLNDEDGASEFGHTGLLLVDKKGNGVLFSYGAATGNFFYGDARMYIGTYDSNGVAWLLNNQYSFVINEDGEWLLEQYNRWRDFNVSSENGYRIFENAVDATVNLEKYAVLWNNCDQMVIEALGEGGIEIEEHLIPNNTYEGIS